MNDYNHSDVMTFLFLTSGKYGTLYFYADCKYDVSLKTDPIVKMIDEIVSDYEKYGGKFREY